MENTHRELQLIELNILRRAIEIIEANGLHYYAIGGTALGAVRHKGFIPWDDDIDIGMPRKEYDKLHKLLKNENIPFLWHWETQQMIQYHTRIINKNAKVVWDHYGYDETVPAFIDIFPLDILPANCFLRRFDEFRIYLYRTILGISLDVKINKKRSKIRSFLWMIVRAVKVKKFLNSEHWFNRYDRLLKSFSYKYDEVDDNYYINASSPYKYRESHKISDFIGGVSISLRELIL